MIPKLLVLYLYVTDKCNLSCAHCWIDCDNKKDHFIDIEQLNSILNSLLELGLKQVNITGGEPVLHYDLIGIVKMFYERNITIYLNTNGTLLSDKLCGELSRYKDKVFCSVSVDGALAETHDKIRGCNGAYIRTIRGIQKLVSHELPCEIIFTIQKRNLGELEQIILIAYKLGVNLIRINFLQYGSGKRINVLKNDEGDLSILEIIELKNKIGEVMAKTRIKVLTNLPFSFYQPNEINDMKYRVCGTKNALGILPDGTVSLCGVGQLNEELNMGNINVNSIKQIWNDNEIIKYIRDCLPQKLEGVCGKCVLRTICCGYCVAQNYMDNGKLNSPYGLCKLLYENNLFPEKYLES